MTERTERSEGMRSEGREGMPKAGTGMPKAGTA